MDVSQTSKKVTAITLAVLLGTVALWFQPEEVRGAAITYVTAANNKADNGGSVNLTLGSTFVTEGNFMVVAICIADDDSTDFDLTVSGVSGWTEAADIFVDDTDNTNLAVFYKIAGASEPTTITADGKGGTDTDTVVVAMSFDGVDLTTPLDVAAVTKTEANTLLVDPASVDHNNNEGVAVVTAGCGAHAGGADTFTASAGYTTNFAQQAGSDTTDSILGIGYNLSPSDPEDPAQWTSSQADNVSNSNAVVTLALRAEADPVADTPEQSLIWFH
jgi:hypothetical protein